MGLGKGMGWLLSPSHGMEKEWAGEAGEAGLARVALGV
jgi:hypothetical protein